MGAFNSSQRPSITIKDQPGWDAGEWIRIKGVVTADTIKACTKQQTMTGNDGKVIVASDTDMVEAMRCMIEDWMLLGDRNMPVDLYETSTRRKRTEIIGELPAEYMGPVMEAIGKLMAKSQVQQPKDFTNAANGQSPAPLSVVS